MARSHLVRLLQILGQLLHRLLDDLSAQIKRLRTPSQRDELRLAVLDLCGWDGVSWDGVGWDGVGWDGVGWMAWDGMGWDGIGQDGIGWSGVGWSRTGQDG